MGIDSGQQLGQERRRFIRLPYILPVEFYLVSPDHKKRLSSLIQGFTRNVSQGGLCLEVNNLEEHLALTSLSGQAEFLLYINLPFSRYPVETYGRVAWLKKADSYPHKFLLGISYFDFNLPETMRPVRFAKSIRRCRRLIAAFLIFLVFALAGASFSNVILRRTNKILVDKLVKISEEQSIIARKIFYLEDLKEVLNSKSKEIELYISNLPEGNEEEFQAAYKELEDLERKLKDLEEGETLLQKELAEIQGMKTGVEKKTVKKMYDWLKMRQNRNTGLVFSYEGDPFLKDWAFTYDQALVAQCFLLFENVDSARKILDFYRKRAKKINGGGFYSAYDVTTGHIVEYVGHSGPNIWIGLSTLQYINKTGDETYLDFAEEIARWIMALQDEDPEGGIRGGSKVNWFSTEHNLDAHAFFAGLYKFTKKKEYLEASQKVLSWLKENAYMKAERRLKRGKGDATIATDTLSWAVAALGPALLIEEGMHPDDILAFAEEHCKVTVDYAYPSGEKVEITGFDFAKARNIGRSGIISTEWTAQMIVSFNIMGNFYLRQNNLKKAGFYQDKAEFFLAELDKLTINNSCKTGQGAICLPYASHQNVDTGHGWRTPKGNRTGCIAGTVYAIFAKKGFNPFEIK